MEIIFLGTACMQPTKKRNHPGILLLYKGDGLLFDCGEGIQRQLKIAGIRPTKITKIFLTHWDGDHFFGLPGLLQTMQAAGYDHTLELYGPKGTREMFELLKKLMGRKFLLEVKVSEVKKGTIVQEEDYEIHADELKHTSPCVGFAFAERNKRKMLMSVLKKLGVPEGPLVGKLQEGKKIIHQGREVAPDQVSKVIPGRKIVYATDTRPCAGLLRLAEGADILILESTFKSDLEEKAKEFMHLTAREAGQIANEAHVKKLFLTHFSQRYKDVSELEEDARDVFDNTQAAEDFMKIKI